jgi:hypothetical protein
MFDSLVPIFQPFLVYFKKKLKPLIHIKRRNIYTPRIAVIYTTTAAVISYVLYTHTLLLLRMEDY